MKYLRKLSRLALALLIGVPAAAQAQVPGVPAVPAAVPAPGVAVPVTPVATAVPQRNLWSFLCLTPEQRARCKARFCGSQFGQLINNTLAPPSALTGGVIPQPCPGPNGLNPADLALPPTSALGAAAQVKKDTLEAAARRQAIRYLSTADCNWWPEAQAALANTLRADRNECVRLEAAVALQRGCCCRRETIEALTFTVSGSRADGNPPEDSPRVRAAAMAALEHCLACYVAIVPAPPCPVPPPAQSLPLPRREGPPPLEVPPANRTPPPPPGSAPAGSAQPRLQPLAYPRNLSMEQMIQEARRVLKNAQQAQATAKYGMPMKSHSLGEVFENAFHFSTPAVVASNPATGPSEAPPTIFGSRPITSVVVNRPAPQPTRTASAPRPFLAPPVIQTTTPSPAYQAVGVSAPPAAPRQTIPPPPAATTRPLTQQPPPATPSLYAVAAARAAAVASVHERTPTAPPSPPVPPTARKPEPTPVLSIPEKPISINAPTPLAKPVTPPVLSVPEKPAPSAPASSSSGISVSQMLLLLRDSPYQDVREYAATSLVKCGELSPPVVRALANGAHADASADVRLACLQGLLKLPALDPVRRATVARLQEDRDPRIRNAAATTARP